MMNQGLSFAYDNKKQEEIKNDFRKSQTYTT
jgi:hypothetical protein